MIDEVFADRAAASREAAGLIAEALRSHLAEHVQAGLVVSGGSTPAACLDELSHADLPWSQVRVTLTDERCVPVSHADSNERMVRERLLTHRAAAAEFVPLGAEMLSRVPRPFACSLVGVGEDGHFASLFPDAAGLETALTLDGPARCVPISTAASPYPRVSMTLSLLVDSRLIVLLAFGAAKRRVLEAPGARPVGRLLEQTRAPVRVLWAP